MTPDDFHKKYPNVFKKPIYFECFSGWYPLLDELCSKIENKLKFDHQQEHPMDRREEYVTQIKEKFGTLRFYFTATTDEIWDLIDEAEEKSGTICERCGKPGTLRNNHPTKWVMTRCDDCF